MKYRIPAGQEVVFFDDFENGLDQWTTVRNGDGTTSTDWRTTDATGFDGGTNHSGNNVAMSRSWATNAYSVDNWLISPQVTLDGTLKFWVMDDGMYHEHYDIYVSTTTNDIDAFELLNSPGNATAAWKEVSVDLSSYAGQQGYIAIRHTDEDQDYLWIDDFGIYGGEIPAGPWQEVATDETSVELTGLESDTEYELVVVGIKGGEENEGSAPVTFTTLSENDKLFVTAGNWDVAENWLPAGLPTATSNLIIQKDVTIPAGVIALANNIVLDGGSITIKDGGQLKQNTDDLQVTIEKDIKGYGESTEAADYNLIASSLGVNVTVNSTGALTGTRDMYSFSQNQTQEWRRVQNGNIAAANGYLYASQDDRTLKFTGTTLASVDNAVTLSITYNESATYSFNGYQLIGNPYPCDAYVTYISSDYDILPSMFYKTNAAGDGFEAYYEYVKLAPGEGAFIQVNTSGYIYLSSDPIFSFDPELEYETYVPVLPQHGLNSNQDADLNLLLADDADNSAALAKYLYENGNVTLQGRTLYKDGSWNTLTLPFDLNSLTGTPLAGATVKELDTDGHNGFDTTDGTLYLSFADATEIEAGKPYLVKWESGTDVTNPVFSNVGIAADEPTDVVAQSAELDEVQFRGTFSPLNVAANDQSILFMGADNTLYYSNIDRTLRAFRAHFYIPGATTASARRFVINFGDVTTGIQTIGNAVQTNGSDAWYSLDGRQLSGKPAKGGVYVHGNSKVVIK
ncbi:MAG: choice-of-anchor J domain-containing protein [Prevotella sp.]|nr:choice-of-anchor J domain-containing protein [Prevotella sp.]